MAGLAAKDFIHFFTKQKDEYLNSLPELKGQIKPNGIIWVSWPKKASKVATDITEDIIRNFALQSGLVDIKVCAVDEVWSGLKLVIPGGRERLIGLRLTTLTINFLHAICLSFFLLSY